MPETHRQVQTRAMLNAKNWMKEQLKPNIEQQTRTTLVIQSNNLEQKLWYRVTVDDFPSYITFLFAH